MLAIVGGTGLYSLPGFELVQEHNLETPFGFPSGPVLEGRVGSQRILFLSRHGAGHKFLPHEVNYRANVFALKSLGARALLSVSAVGSLRQELRPGDLVAIDQYIDFTRGRRVLSFFGEGVVAHIQSASPVSAELHSMLLQSSGRLKFAERKLHKAGTYVCVEGPRLGTRAESLMFRGLGADVVGMTNVPEVFLAREAQLAYASVGVVTDYDSWQDEPSLHVDVAKIFELYSQSLGDVLRLLGDLSAHYNASTIEACPSRHALKGSLLTPKELVPATSRAWVEQLLL